MTHGDIMIVDDKPANLKLLEDMLVLEGHEVRSLPLGRLALAAALKHPPDLILLDINMPEMNGYEVCERLKATPALARIPVIFLSALNETQDKVKAFQFGAVDYICKPFQFEEVHARVDTHLTLYKLRNEMERLNESLEQSVSARTRELADANERLRILDSSKNEFLGLISHEFRTPLNGLFGTAEMILESMPPTEENATLRQLHERSRQRILAMLDDSLLLAQIDVNGEMFRSARVSLHAALKRAVEATASFAASRKVLLELPSGGLDVEMADEDLLVKALRALLETAVKFSTDGETVRLIYEARSGSATLTIDSQGMTIPDAVLPRFFDLFSVSEASTSAGDLGLGPAVAHRILSLFGATLTVSNREPAGIRLLVSLKDVSSLSPGPTLVNSPFEVCSRPSALPGNAQKCPLPFSA